MYDITKERQYVEYLLCPDCDEEMEGRYIDYVETVDDYPNTRKVTKFGWVCPKCKKEVDIPKGS